MMKKIKFSEHTVFIWRLHATLVMAAAAFLSGAVFVFSPGIGVFTGITFLLFYLIFMIFYAPLLYRRCFFIIEKDGLIIEKGAIFHKRYKIPVDRIQYTEFVQTPVQRFKKVYSAVFHTAGSIIMLNQISEKNVSRIKRLTGDRSATKP